LRPPYKIATGMRLLIPGSGSGAVPPETVIEQAAGAPAVDKLPPGRAPDVIPLDGPLPPRASATPPLSPASPAAAAVAAEVARENELAVPAPAGPRAASAARTPAAAPDEGPPPPAMHGGRFAWPVQGRVLASYGAGSGGAHNDGINIAAARGTPIKAVEGGVVAYAGNELRGYGNLVLVKHPDGLISAYAHCDELLVKKGEKVGPGQVIGRVGASGGVAEPQLHFELRRGKHPVDPREFLGASPSAAGVDAGRG
jgi:murein DD-endopeptidase MepM/ murein hydrolase activator NlpD